MLLFKGWTDCSILESSLSVLLRGGWTAVFWSLHCLCCCLGGGLTAVFWILHSLCCCFKHGLQYCGVCSLSVLLFQAWIDCSILESLHHPLHGLCNSLVTYSQQWCEYFQVQSLRTAVFCFLQTLGGGGGAFYFSVYCFFIYNRTNASE